MTTDQYVLEWSQKQGMPHVQRLIDTLSTNRRAYRDDMPTNDYILIAIGTFDEMMDAADAITPTLAKRRPEKFTALTLTGDLCLPEKN